jgi:hypothetical protein
MLITISISLLIVLYALAWHDEPARQPVVVRRNHPKNESHE